MLRISLKSFYCVLLVSVLAMFRVSAQEQPLTLIPVDPEVRIGVLDNGLTYYIRHNEKPEGQAFFYLAQKVGSILEEENQRGLAHFLEHMSFNGTENFRGNSIVKYLEKIGVQFGGDLNAYTSIDETVNNIDRVPVSVPGAIDSCLLILHDWANGLLLEDKEIDEERGVIHEEWRTRQGATLRIFDQVLPEVYGNNRYGHRLPIGLVSVIDSFPYQAIRDFYETWYRPDQQGIVVVGDIDVEDIEVRIKSLFSTIERPLNPRERVYVPIENNKEPIISIAKDKEMNVVSVDIFNKHEAIAPEEKKTIGYMVYCYSRYMISNMFSSRFQEILQKADAPFISASASDGDFFISKTKGAFQASANLKEDNIEGGTKCLIREVMRAMRYGFTPSEYERARVTYMSALETMYNERQNTQSLQYVNSYVRNFIDGEPIPGIEQEYSIMNQFALAISVDVINQLLASIVCDSNWVMVMSGPDKEEIAYPSKDQLKSYLTDVINEVIEPYVDTMSDKPLIEEPPTPGKIVNRTKGLFGSTQMTMSNGATVIIKETDLKQDEILMYAFSRGGNSVFDDSEFINFCSMDEVVSLGGVGEFSVIDLQKILAGKRANVITSVGSVKESMSGACSPRHLDIMMQLLYLRFTSPRQDMDAYNSYVIRRKAVLQNQELLPETAMSDTLRYLIYGDNPRVQRIKDDMLDNMDYDRIMQLYRSRFADASGFTFIFVGNINADSAASLMEQYIGSLPSAKCVHKESVKGLPFFLDGNRSVVFNKQMEIPLATVAIVYSGKMSYNLRNHIIMSLLEQTLQVVYTEEIREKEGGAYAVGTRCSIDLFPMEQFHLVVSFDTDPARAEELMQKSKDIFEHYAVDGPTQANLDKIKEYLLKSYKENQKENDYWLSVLADKCWVGLDYDTDYEKILNSITVDDVRDLVRDMLSVYNCKVIIMKGTTE